MRCAIGVCLPDHLYDPAMENHSPVYLQGKWPEMYDEVFNGIDPLSLDALQDAHDSQLSPIREKLESVAEQLHLTIPSK